MSCVKVSVIFICYNQERFIERALSSVQLQSYSDFEVIVVDDGSNDNSRQVITKVSRSFTRIKNLYHQNYQNKGICSTYEFAIENADGEYLFFLEADDCWPRDYLQKKMEIFDKFPEVGVVFSKCKILSGRFFGQEMKFRQWLLQLKLPKQPFSNFARLLQKNNIATFSAFAVRRSEMYKVPTPKDIRMLFYDWWVLCHLSVNTKFYFRRDNYTLWNQSRSSALNKEKFSSHKRMVDLFYCDLLNSFKEFSMPDKERNIFIHKQKNIFLFMQFYKKPTFLNFYKFFRKTPLWALESLASYMVNFYKYF